MSIGKRLRGRPGEDATTETAGLLGDRDNRLITVAGLLISATVLYDVYRRRARAKAAGRSKR